MIDDLVDIAVAASADIAIDKALKRHPSIRILRAIGGLLFFALIVGLIYVTVKYLKMFLPNAAFKRDTYR